MANTRAIYVLLCTYLLCICSIHSSQMEATCFYGILMKYKLDREHTFCNIIPVGQHTLRVKCPVHVVIDDPSVILIVTYEIFVMLLL